MPQGPGTYGKQVGRPSTKKRSGFKMKGDPMGRNFGIGRTKPGPPQELNFKHNWDDVDESKNTLERGSTSLTEKKTFGGDATDLSGKTKLGSLVDEKRETEKERIAREKAERDAKANKDRTVTNEAGEIINTAGDTDAGKLPPELKWHEKAAWQDSGAGHMVEAGKSIARGIKNLRDKRKAKKAQKIADAKEAVGSGSETLKQAKLVERNRKKADRKAKSDAIKAKKDKKKLTEYRKKNPVRGKEAINLVTGGGNKSLV